VSALAIEERPRPAAVRGANATTRVLLVGGDRLECEALELRFSRGEFAVVAAVRRGGDGVLEAERHQPDVVVLELELPDLAGADVCARILESAPGAAVVAVSGSASQGSVAATLRAGARAFLVAEEEIGHLDLAAAIRCVLRGEHVLAPGATAALLRQVGPVQPRPPDGPALSRQELRMLALAAQGLSNREIGVRVYLSRYTVKEYLSNAMRKLGATSRVEAVLEASRRGLLDAPAEPIERGVLVPLR
jgi:DNA-binding NarL/FixJ family response regulator